MTEVWRPSVTVAGVIERDGKFLLIEERSDGRAVLNQPAGHLEPNETLVQACVREVLEETAHRFEPTGLVAIYRWIYAPRDVTFLRFAFRGRVLGTVDRPLDAEILGVHWLTPAEISERRAQHRSPLVQQCVDDYLAGGNYPLELLSKAYG